MCLKFWLLSSHYESISSMCLGKLNFQILFAKNKKPLFTRFENLFLTPTPNGESRHPQAVVICGPSQNAYDGEKKFRKNTVVSEKIRV